MLLDLALILTKYCFFNSSLIDFLSHIVLKLITQIMNDSLFLLIDFLLSFIDYFRSAYFLIVNLFS